MAKEEVEHMNINLIGRVSNVVLGVHKPLQPLFEAVVNSFHAIESLGIPSGRVKIVAVRDEGEQSSIIPNFDSRHITGFVVEDNGVGFDDANYTSFTTSDTKYKKGAKGIGRFLWLKAFEKVSVESSFQDGTEYFTRKFDFELTANGIENHECLPAKANSHKTTVSLHNFQPKFRENCSKSLQTIAEKLIEHTLIHFLGNDCPTVTLEDGSEKLSLNDIFNSNVKDKSKSVVFKIKNQEFNLLNLRLYLSEEANHKVHLCANDRVVTSRDIGKRIPDLRAKLLDENGNVFKYAGYIRSLFLDENVNQERTEFSILREEESETLFPDLISIEEIERMSLRAAKDYLQPYLEPIAKNKWEHISRFVENKAPQYRAALKHKPKSVEDIPPGLSDEKLDIELHKINASINVDLKLRSNKVLNKSNEEIIDLPKYIREYQSLVEEVTDFSKSQLAQYIVHRKIIIDLLEKSLRLTDSGKYHLEETVHGIIFPLRTSSEDVDYEQQNLWLIDERLSYHRFLASDQRFDEMHIVEVESKDRPDLVVFNTPLAYVESSAPFSSIVVVEFKRPMRKDYGESDDNPFEQIYDYIRQIKTGRVQDKNGRPINLPAGVPFYGYVICDIAGKVAMIAENYGFTKTPDGLGYFNFNTTLSAYIELISYDKLVEDSKKRNRILFDKLHIPIS